MDISGCGALVEISFLFQWFFSKEPSTTIFSSFLTNFLGIIPPLGMNSSVAITNDEKLFIFGGFDKYSGDGKFGPVTFCAVRLTPQKWMGLSTSWT